MSRMLIVGLAVCVLLLACGPARPSVTTASRVVEIQQSADSLPCYDVFELAVENGGHYANNFFDVTLSATFTSPDGAPRSVRGFFFGGDTWKVRFRPDTPGQWTYTALMTGTDGSRQQMDGQFSCTPSASEGPVQRNPSNPFGWVLGNGQPYVPVGLEDCWNANPMNPRLVDGEGRNDGSGRQVSVDEYFALYGQAGFNLFRFSPNNCSYPLYADLDHFSEPASLATDQLLDTARKHGLRVWFGFFGYNSDPQHSIANAAALGVLPLASREKRFIEYCVARWGVYADFWELLNESDASPAWSILMADYVRSIDPDHKPITSSPVSNPLVVPGTDFVSPHWYESEDELASDAVTQQNATAWRQPGLPVIVGEQGNTGMNWDPGSALRMRIRAWTAMFEQIGLVFWNTNWSKAGMNEGKYTPGSTANIYLGPEERGYISSLRAFAGRLDARVVPAQVSVSDPGKVRAYGLASSSVAAAYLHHFQDHTSSVSGQVSLAVPGDQASAQPMIGQWIDPATGAVVATTPLLPGPQTLEIPPFRVDLALLVSPEQGQ